MNLREGKFLADENIQSQVIRFLINEGIDVISVFEYNLDGLDDEVVLSFAHQQNRVVLTHDSDFGTLTVAGNQPFTGIIYLKPGHIAPEHTIQSLETLFLHAKDISLPCIIVVQRNAMGARIRIRPMK